MGQALAKKWKCTFLETSAKDRGNVNEVKAGNKISFIDLLHVFRYFSILFDKLIAQVITHRIALKHDNQQTMLGAILVQHAQVIYRQKLQQV